MKTCDICGQESNFLTFDYNKAYCDTCWCETHSVCSSCGDEVLDDNMSWSEKRQDFVCECCYNEFESEDEDE